MGASSRATMPLVLPPEVDDELVATVLAELRAEDDEIASSAQHAWHVLTAGEGPDMVSQASLQEWLWWLLPKRMLGDEPEWRAAAEGAAALFERLGAGRYAEICRSPSTDAVLAAWSTGREAGIRACRAAQERSGVEPPDLDDFVWADQFGHQENDARSAVARALEAAIVEGRLEPGRRGWKAEAARVCAEVLDADLGLGQSHRTLVRSERVERWATRRSLDPDQHERRLALGARLVAGPPDEPSLEHPPGPLRWLLETCLDGAKLTSSHYLSPVLVREACDRFGWWPFDKPPRSESELHQLEVVRETARDLGLVRRRGTTLTTTAAGRSLLADDVGLWRRWTTALSRDEDYPIAVAEELALCLLDRPGRLALAEVEDLVVAELAAQSWYHADGSRPTRRSFEWAVHEPVRAWRLWGMLDEVESRWERGERGPVQVQQAEIGLNAYGRHAVWRWLHDRAVGGERLR